MALAHPARWLVTPRPDPGAALRLICFPHAGSGTVPYRGWHAALPGIEQHIVALPGREARSREPLLRQLAPLVTALADAVAAQLVPPFAIYGHSLGAFLGFAFARELRRRGLPGPVHLFASGRQAPQIPRPAAPGELSDDELRAQLRELGGTPDEVLREPELMALILPVLRADLAINASPIDDEPPLPCPITALGGIGDRAVSPDGLEAWRDQTTAAFEREMFAGGHFFPWSAQAEVLGSVARRLTAWSRH